MDRIRYFKDSNEDITINNSNILHIVSLASTFLIALFLIITPCIFPYWKISMPYYILVFVNLFFTIMSVICKYRHVHNMIFLKASVYLYYAFLMGIMIVIDVFTDLDGTSTFTPLFLAVSPALFILPYYITLPFITISDIIFIVLAHTFKESRVAESDIFISLVGLSFGICIAVVVTNLRINESKTKNRYRTLSQIDRLTKLYNKSTFEDLTEEYLRNRHFENSCAFFIVDIDDFKSINDIYGHHTGDKVLVEFAQALADICDKDSYIGRFGGDEYVMLIQNADDTAIARICGKINSSIAKITTGIDDYHITCSIGISYSVGQFVSYNEFFKVADDALYEAKNFGKNQYVMHYVKSLSIASGRKKMLVVDDSDVLRAIIHETFRDKFDVIEARNGREALDMVSQYSKQLDIVLLDIHMDDINGYDVIQFMKARTHTSRIPIIVITADSDSEEKALYMGADDMISKPIDPSIALLRVEKAIHNHIWKTKDNLFDKQ